MNEKNINMIKPKGCHPIYRFEETPLQLRDAFVAFLLKYIDYEEINVFYSSISKHTAELYLNRNACAHFFI